MKLISIRIVLAIFILPTLTHCVSHNEKRIVVWNQMQPSERIVLDKHLAIFSKNHPEWEFKQLYYETEELRTNFQIAALGGSGPALVHGPSDNIGPMVELGVLQPLEELFDQEYLDSFITEPYSPLTYLNGHLWQIGDQIGNHLCLVYNKDLLPNPPKTMSELIKVGLELTKDTDGDGKTDTYGLVWNYIEPYFYFPFFTGYGGVIFDENNLPVLNSDASIKAMQLIADLRNVHKIIPLECNYDIANSMFKEGRAAMIINGPWSWGTYQNAGLNFGLAKIPMIDETGLWPSPMVAPRGYSMNPNLTEDQQKIAIDLVKYLTSPEVTLEFAERINTIPARKEAYFSDAVQNNPILQASIEQLKVGTLLPVITEMRVVWDGMRPGYQRIFEGKATPKDAADEMQKNTVKRIRDLRK